MSRRYGRRQKRRHLEEIDNLANTASGLYESLIQERIGNEILRKRLYLAAREMALIQQRFDAWDCEIKALLGRYSSARITPATFRVSKGQVLRQLKVDEQPLSLSALSTVDLGATASLSFYVEDMLRFIMDLSEQDLMNMRRYLTVRIERDDYREAYAAYAFSESHWRDIKAGAKDNPEALTRHIHRIAEEFMDILTRPKKKEQEHGRSGLSA